MKAALITALRDSCGYMQDEGWQQTAQLMLLAADESANAKFASYIAGLLAGVGGAAALSQMLRQILYGISSFDPMAYLAAIGLFVMTAALAALLPATFGSIWSLATGMPSL